MSLPPTKVERARELRKNLTDAERLLWSRLRRRQIHGRRFRRQHPIGPFIADFACTEAKLVIELDGGQHVERKDQDAARTRWLAQRGYRILRFWNNEVLSNIDGVLTVIMQVVAVPSPHPSPANGRGSLQGGCARRTARGRGSLGRRAQRP